MLKKNIILIMFIFIAAFVFSLDEINVGDLKVDASDSKALYFFYEMHDLVTEKRQKNQELRNTIQYIKEKIDNNELYIIIREIKDSTILTGAYFIFPAVKDYFTPYIIIDKKLVDLESKQKSIILTVLSHELRHAYDYFRNMDYFVANSENELEKYLYEMDAYYFEVLLIENVLKKKRFKLSKFENYALKCHKTDNLASFSLAFKGYNMELIYYINYIPRNIKKSSEGVDELVKVGRDLIDNFEYDELKDDWSKYIRICTLNSFYKFMPFVLFNIISGEYNLTELNTDDLYKYSEELHEIYKAIYLILESKIDFYMEYNKGIIEEFENF